MTMKSQRASNRYRVINEPSATIVLRPGESDIPLPSLPKTTVRTMSAAEQATRLAMPASLRNQVWKFLHGVDYRQVADVLEKRSAEFIPRH